MVVTELLKHLDGINDVDCQASYRVAVKKHANAETPKE